MEQEALAVRIDNLEKRLKRSQRTTLAIAGAAVMLLAGAAALPDDGILHARGLVIHDAKGVDRIYLGAPVPSAPGETRDRISPAVGMILLDENRRERWGLGLQDSGWLVMGFDAAPGAGRGPNRERLHLGVSPEGQGFLRYLDQDSGLAGRLILNDENKLALEFWNKQGDRLARSQVDLGGWRKLPDQPMPAKTR